jgi:hypothetical protein
MSPRGLSSHAAHGTCRCATEPQYVQGQGCEGEARRDEGCMRNRRRCGSDAWLAASLAWMGAALTRRRERTVLQRCASDVGVALNSTYVYPPWPRHWPRGSARAVSFCLARRETGVSAASSGWRRGEAYADEDSSWLQVDAAASIRSPAPGPLPPATVGLDGQASLGDSQAANVRACSSASLSGCHMLLLRCGLCADASANSSENLGETLFTTVPPVRERPAREGLFIDPAQLTVRSERGLRRGVSGSCSGGGVALITLSSQQRKRERTTNRIPTFLFQKEPSLSFFVKKTYEFYPRDQNYP